MVLPLVPRRTLAGLENIEAFRWRIPLRRFRLLHLLDDRENVRRERSRSHVGGSAAHGSNLPLRRAHDRNVCGLDLGSFPGALAQMWIARRSRRSCFALRDVCHPLEDRKSSPGFRRRFVFRANLSLYPGLAWLRSSPALGFGLDADQGKFLEYRDPADRALVLRTLSRPSA